MQAIADAYLSICRLLERLRSPLLLAIRLYWGWQFMQDGWGKLTHLGRVTEFFASLNLPAPGATALVVASVELFGGILFTVGILSRLTSLVLFVNMTMAYLSVPDDRTNFSTFSPSPKISTGLALIPTGSRRCSSSFLAPAQSQWTRFCADDSVRVPNLLRCADGAL